jgi:hypothetical protein
MLSGSGFVRMGVGSTVMVNFVVSCPGQLSLLAMILTLMVALMESLLLLVAIKGGMFPLPLTGKPIAVLLFVQVNEASGELLLKLSSVAELPSQNL